MIPSLNYECQEPYVRNRPKVRLADVFRLLTAFTYAIIMKAHVKTECKRDEGIEGVARCPAYGF